MRMDPLSVLGAAIGVTSLVIQITDECVKGYKFYSEAVNMPNSYRYLRVRLQIEQQRFLNFGLEAGLLYADGVLCASLRVNRSLLLAVLAEIKTILDTYAAANGKYKEFLSQEDLDWKDSKEPETDLMDMLCPSMETKGKVKTENSTRKKDPLKYLRKFGDPVIEVGRNLRTILVEPKRLVWGALDKESFENLVSKLEQLNSFLITLLDGSQIRRLQDTMNTAYLEIMQIRNDVESLTWLVKALTPTAKIRQGSEIDSDGFETKAFSQAVTEETQVDQKRKEYLKRLVEIKIKYTQMGQLSSKPSISSNSGQFGGASLDLHEFEFVDDGPDWESLPQRTVATYRGKAVWIEWKDTSASGNPPATSQEVENRICLLADLLCYQKPSDFRAAPCLGYVKTTNGENEARFGIVFGKPPDAGAESQLLCLHDLLGRPSPRPSLSARMSLCAVLALCIHSFHSVNWLHKGLRGNNVIFFHSPSEQLDVSLPYVTGFELSRPSIIDEMTEKPGWDPSKDIYRHPNAQSTQTDGSYRKSYDLYSLGIVLIEIGMWKRIEDVVGFENLSRAKPSALREMQSWLLERPLSGNAALPPIPVDTGPCLLQLASACGDAFCNVVASCLTADEVEKPLNAGEVEKATASRLQRVTELSVLRQLEHIAGALQAH